MKYKYLFLSYNISNRKYLYLIDLDNYKLIFEDIGIFIYQISMSYENKFIHLYDLLFKLNKMNQVYINYKPVNRCKEYLLKIIRNNKINSLINE